MKRASFAFVLPKIQHQLKLTAYLTGPNAYFDISPILTLWAWNWTLTTNWTLSNGHNERKLAYEMDLFNIHVSKEFLLCFICWEKCLVEMRKWLFSSDKKFVVVSTSAKVCLSQLNFCFFNKSLVDLDKLLNYEISWSKLKYLEVSWNILKYLEISPSLKKNIFWSTLKHSEVTEIFWNFVKQSERSWSIVWNILKYLEIFWNIFKELEVS